jgi:hypothetical protein
MNDDDIDDGDRETPVLPDGDLRAAWRRAEQEADSFDGVSSDRWVRVEYGDYLF